MVDVDEFKMYEADHSVEALVFAAGQGSRLENYARQKVIESIAKILILGRILRGLKESGIIKVHIVVGCEEITYEKNSANTIMGWALTI